MNEINIYKEIFKLKNYINDCKKISYECSQL